jgi:hypothetical protein
MFLLAEPGCSGAEERSLQRQFNPPVRLGSMLSKLAADVESGRILPRYGSDAFNFFLFRMGHLSADELSKQTAKAKRQRGDVGDG